MIDLRSDTVTKPTDEMRRAMAMAEVGDDLRREDPTVRALEERAASMLGKETALFLASGTMANLVAVASQAKPGDVVIMETQAHIYRSEGAHLARISGVLPRQIEGVLGVLAAKDVEDAILNMPAALGFPVPTLICHENTHNAAGGTCASVEELSSVKTVAIRHKLRIHIDGARVFNAAIALGVPVRSIAEQADTVSFCLSKGLACPFGSLLTGDGDVIEEAGKVRQMIGGGMRQAGIMAAAGLVALDSSIDRLAEDHMNARYLAETLVDLGFGVDLRTVQTNIVFIDSFPGKLSRDTFLEGLVGEGVLVGPSGPRKVRMVTHCGITRRDIEDVLRVVTRLLAPSKAA